jgi:hypothetical protein
MTALVENKFASTVERRGEIAKMEYLPPPPLTYGPSAENPAISAAVSVERDDVFGRKVVATRDLNTGV